MRLLIFINAILLTSFTGSISASATIGEVTSHTGSTSISRSTEMLDMSDGLSVNLNDVAMTSNGRLAIQFIDEAQLRLTEHSKVLIDTIIYDPDPDKSKMVLKFAQGTARFASGKLALINKANIVIETPVATIGIRGTDFTTTIDEIGRSLIILLPDENGDSSGEITVSNSAGTTILKEPYQATMVKNLDTSPSRAVIISNITVNQIDNMFIVAPPDEIAKIQSDDQQTSNLDNDYLDDDLLEFDELEKDYFAEDKEFVELDIDVLKADFLQDIMEILDGDISLSKVSNAGIKLAGSSFGYDEKTQYNIMALDDKILFYREVGSIISLRVDPQANLTLSTYTDGTPSIIRMNDGEGIEIIITQRGE